jgi:transposase
MVSGSSCKGETLVARPSKLPVSEKEQIVLAILRGELSVKDAAQRGGVSETSIATWKEQFLRGGRDGLSRGKKQEASSRERQLEEENRDLVQALGELHVRLRQLERGSDGVGSLSFR